MRKRKVKKEQIQHVVFTFTGIYIRVKIRLICMSKINFCLSNFEIVSKQLMTGSQGQTRVITPPPHLTPCCPSACFNLSAFCWSLFCCSCKTLCCSSRASFCRCSFWRRRRFCSACLMSSSSFGSFWFSCLFSCSCCSQKNL